MIELLLPQEVASFETRLDAPEGSLFPEEVTQLGWAVDKRRREFTAGRMCARQSLMKLGLPETSILRDTQRAPIWPQEVVGSITHCHGYRAAAVAWNSEIMSIGIDAEPHEELPANVLALVTQDSERAWLATAPDGIHWDRLFFSAKESVYKAWYPLTGLWLGFEDVTLDISLDRNEFRASFIVKPSVGADILEKFYGKYLVQDDLLLTTVVCRRHIIKVVNHDLPEDS